MRVIRRGAVAVDERRREVTVAPRVELTLCDTWCRGCWGTASRVGDPTGPLWIRGKDIQPRVNTPMEFPNRFLRPTHSVMVKEDFRSPDRR